MRNAEGKERSSPAWRRVFAALESRARRARSGRRRAEARSLFRPRRKKSKEGFSLADIAIAIFVASIVMASTLGLIAQGQEMRREAERLAVAVTLAQANLTPLAANPNLKSMDPPVKTYGEDYGIYAGYEVKINVKEEEVDLAKVAASGELSGVPIDDQLPPETTNKTASQKKGEVSPQTGFNVKLLRIKVTVRYPRGGKYYGEYTAETFRGSPK